ncbi:MAG TPA: chromate resistance protein [Saprospiraceae bacterium]|nr:chromate resistance protein [Saprospiraceae bacterium]HNT20854.1 chromate resistance protein [Saprospiraceae bacterium]
MVQNPNDLIFIISIPSEIKWITRDRPKIDRFACPWLITRFVDREAEFIYVPLDHY